MDRTLKALLATLLCSTEEKNGPIFQGCKLTWKMCSSRCTNSFENLVSVLKIFPQNDKKQALSQGAKLLP